MEIHNRPVCLFTYSNPEIFLITLVGLIGISLLASSILSLPPCQIDKWIFPLPSEIALPLFIGGIGFTSGFVLYLAVGAHRRFCQSSASKTTPSPTTTTTLPPTTTSPTKKKTSSGDTTPSSRTKTRTRTPIPPRLRENKKRIPAKKPPVTVRTKVPLRLAMEAFGSYHEELLKKYPQPADDIETFFHCSLVQKHSGAAALLKQQGETRPQELIRVLYGWTTQNLQQSDRDLIYKSALLKGLLEDYTDYETDGVLSQWLSSLTVLLEKDLKRGKDTSLVYEPMQESLKDCQSKLLKSAKERRSAPINEPTLTHLLEGAGTKIASPTIYPRGTFQPQPSRNKATPNTLETLPKPPPLSFKLEKPYKFLGQVKEWKEYLFALYSKRQCSCEVLEGLCYQFLAHLPDPIELVRTRFFEEEKIQLAEFLQNISTLTLTLHVILRRPCLPASRLAVLLKNLHLCLSIIQEIHDAHFKDYTVPIDCFLFALQDPYLDLGSYGTSIAKTLSKIDKLGSHKTLLRESRDQRAVDEDETSYDTIDELKSQWSYDIRYLFESLTSFNCLLQTMTLPQFMINRGENSKTQRENFSDNLTDIEQLFSQTADILLCDRSLLSIKDGYLISPCPDVVFFRSPNFSQLGGFKDPSLDIWKTTGNPITCYALYSKITHGEIRKRLVEGVVSTATRDRSDTDGRCENQERIYYNMCYDPKFTEKFSHGAIPPTDRRPVEGRKQNTYTINADRFVFPHLSLETSLDLQNMASGRDNRASNALYTFRAHPELLNHSQYGRDFKQVLRLYLFRDQMILRELVQQPAQGPLLWKQIKELQEIYARQQDWQSWLFLYRVETDLLGLLKETHFTEAEKALQKQHEEAKEQLKSWIACAEAEVPPKMPLTAFYLTFLYEKALLGFPQTKTDYLAVAQIYLAIRPTLATLELIDPMEAETLRSLGALLTTYFLSHSFNNRELDCLISYKVDPASITRQWKTLGPGCHNSKDLYLDIANWDLFERRGERRGTLPAQVRNHSSLKRLFSKKTLEEEKSFHYVPLPDGKHGGSAWQSEFMQDKRTYSLFSCADGTMLLYRKSPKGNWEQWLSIQEGLEQLPSDAHHSFLWQVGPGEAILENQRGEKLYHLQISNEQTIRHIERYITPDSHVPAFSSSDPFFNSLDNESGYLLFEDKGKKNLLYVRHGLRYEWDETQQTWTTPNYPGYRLSNKPLEEWRPPCIHESSTTTRLFSSQFRHYQLLENDQGKATLLFPLASYTKGIYPNHTPDSTQHSIELNPRFCLPPEMPSLVTLQLEKNGAFSSASPKDHFYLAYLFFIQGKYGEALLQLKNSQIPWSAKEETAERKLIRDWFLAWSDDSANGLALKAHMLLGEHVLAASTFPNFDTLVALDEAILPRLMTLIDQIQKKEAKIDPHLKLTKEQHADICFLKPRAVDWIKKHLDELKPEEQDIIDYYKAHPEATRQEILKFSLRREIDKMHAELKNLSPEESPLNLLDLPPYVQKPLYDFSQWLEPIAAEEKKNPKLDSAILLNELNEVFPEGDPTLANETGRRLVDDLATFKQEAEQPKKLIKTDKLQEIQDALQTEIDRLTRQEKSQRQKILQLFQPPPLKPNSIMKRALKEQEVHMDQLFEQARYCLAAGDFSPLEQIEALLPLHTEQLKKQLHSYLIVRTQRKTFERKKAAIKELAKDPNNITTREETTRCLEEWTVYDVESHPLAMQFLLFEDELNVTLRLSQLKHVHILSLNLRDYLHEAMAGGKTFILRNLYCLTLKKMKKKSLPGVITYAPLMQQHHKLFAQTNQRTIGSDAFCFQFSRENQSDTYAIYQMTLMHLKAVVRKNGYVDQTVNAILSLNNELSRAIIEKTPSSDPSNPQQKETSDYVKAIQELQTVRAELVSLYSDELDKICQADKEHNYAEGKKRTLESFWYEPALLLVDLLQIQDLKEFLDILKANQLPRISQAEFDKYLNQLAEVVYNYFGLTLDKSLTLAYLTESAQNRSQAEEGKPTQQQVSTFYQEKILTLPKEQASALQVLHGIIGLVFRPCKKKQAGVDFGKSKQDKITVKPYKGSDDCQENSQRNLLITSIWETCLDYLINGVTEEGAISYVEAVKARVAKENKKEEETEEGKEFLAQFNLLPSQVKDYGSIANLISQKRGLLSRYLRVVIFTRATYHPEKIEGNSHYLGHLIERIVGSSGSPDRTRTLPRCINSNNPYAYQKAVVGRLLYLLSRDADLCIFSKDPEKQIRETLRPGDTYIDNMPVFPGLSGIEITNKIVPLEHTARFFDTQDEISTRINGKVQKGEESIQHSSTISVITHKGRQGTDWKFAPGTRGILSIGPLTTSTDFFQSLMRLRLYGKGQDAIIFYDPALEKEWEKEPRLAGKSLLTKLIWSLIQHEAEALKVLHYQANRKAILAISQKAIDQIKTTTQDPEILDLIKSFLKKTTVLSPEDVGAPVCLLDSTQLLKDLIAKIQRELGTLKYSIENLKESSEKTSSLNFLRNALGGELTDPDLILDKSLLPEKMPGNHLDIEGFEESEQMIDNDLELPEIATVDVSIGTEYQLTGEQNIDQEMLKPEKHPNSLDGHEADQMSIAATNYTTLPGKPAWWNPEAKNVEDLEVATHGEIDPEVFPLIYASNHGLGIYYGSSEWLGGQKDMVRSPKGKDTRQKRLWFYTDEEIGQQSLSPKVLAVIMPDGKVHIHMGSIKDSDFAFFEPCYRQSHMQWKDISHEEAKECLNELCDDQKKAYSNREEYTSKLTWYRNNMLDHQFFKVDLRETELPPNLPEKHKKMWVKQIALAKFLYVDANFSHEEKEALKEWLETECPVQQRLLLRQRLNAYLQPTHPSDPNHPILALL